MQYVGRLQKGDLRFDRICLGKVCFKGHHLMPFMLGQHREVLTTKSTRTCQQYLQNDQPASLRRKSASTIIWHNCSSVVVGSHPKLALALAGLPISNSTSAGR